MRSGTNGNARRATNASIPRIAETQRENHAALRSTCARHDEASQLCCFFFCVEFGAGESGFCNARGLTSPKPPTALPNGLPPNDAAKPFSDPTGPKFHDMRASPRNGAQKTQNTARSCLGCFMAQNRTTDSHTANF